MRSDLTQPVQCGLSKLALLVLNLFQLGLLCQLFIHWLVSQGLVSLQMIYRLHLHLLVDRLLALLLILEVAAREAEAGVAYVVHDHEQDTYNEDVPPQGANLLRNPLGVPEICHLHTKVEQVDKATSKS